MVNFLKVQETFCYPGDTVGASGCRVESVLARMKHGWDCLGINYLC